jgi:glycosyltransferase involved in cell wall biosynthesis
MDSLFRSYDGILMCNAANAFLCWLPRLKGQKVVLNVDGIERYRRKWNWLAKEFYRVNESLATVFPHVLVTDARAIQDYYLQRHDCPSRFIPYGAPIGKLRSQRALRVLNVSPGQYLLYVGRLEPENNAHQAIKAYLQSEVELPFAVVGDAPYNKRYIEELIELAQSGDVLLPGAIYGVPYRELLSHCRCYLHGAEVGGTHPGLLEAMGAGAVVIANDTPENQEVVGDAGLLCSFEDLDGLTRLLREVVLHPEEFARHRHRAQERVRHHYDWEKVTDQYEELFYELTR